MNTDPDLGLYDQKLKRKITFVTRLFCPPGSGFRIRIHWPAWIRIRIRIRNPRWKSPIIRSQVS